MNRFFVSPQDIGEDIITITEREDLHHISKVLRLKPGDKVEVSDCLKWEYISEIISIDDDCVQVKITDKQTFAGEPKAKVTLFQGVPKQGKMEVIIQKCVELGVHDIFPVFTSRSVVVDNGKFNKKIDRWQKISDEAVKQCKRGIIPKIGDEIKFKELPEHLAGFDLILFPYENEEKTTIKEPLSANKHADKIAVIIGPEGGFSDEEATILKNLGAHCVSLGKTTLRTETAGPAALAMIMYELEL